MLGLRLKEREGEENKGGDGKEDKQYGRRKPYEESYEEPNKGSSGKPLETCAVVAQEQEVKSL